MYVRRIARLAELFAMAPHPDIVAVDVPIGLLDVYEIGGRECDRQARRELQKRGSSVFVPPVRAVLGAQTYEEAKALSRASSVHNRALSRQTWEIVRKIEEADELLRLNPHLRPIVREVHPEVCFCELVGYPMKFAKGRSDGRAERRDALAKVFDAEALISEGRREKLLLEDVLDALVSCWSAMRLAEGRGRRLVADEKTIWV
jgi:predicted RNase H-like nuclease